MPNNNEGIILAAEVAVLAPVMDLAVAKHRLRQFQEFVRDYLIAEEDFGTIPGTNKPTLLKPGADKLCELYGLADTYNILSKTEDFDKGLFDYTIECSLTSRQYGVLVSQGLGSCNSFEGKYRWRDQGRKCPNCGKETIIKGKAEFGGGWLCFGKKGGCGSKWKSGAPEIESQEVGRTLNDDIATLKNTILKMAKKRAKIDATLSATRSSGIFTQDVEDFPHGDTESTPAPSPAAEKKAEQRVEEKNGLATIIGTVTQKSVNGDICMCHVRTEAGDNILLRMDTKPFGDQVSIGAPIKANAKKLPTAGDVRMYGLLDLDTDLTGVLQASVLEAAARPKGAALPPERSSTPATTPKPAVGAANAKNAASPAPATKQISKAQLGRLWALAKGAQWEEKQLRDFAGRFGVEHLHEMTYPKPYNDICNELETYIGGADTPTPVAHEAVRDEDIPF